MPDPKHIKECKKLIRSLERKEYFSVAVNAYRQKLTEIQYELVHSGICEEDAIHQAEKKILSNLHDVMRAAEPLVENYIQSRVLSGAIRNADQARKSAAGNIFQQMVAYSIAKNVVNGNIASHVIVTTSVSHIIEEYAAISVDGEIQTPDSDVIVYSEENANSPILNFSCKTSCRERAGQTYKWKLLCDLATCRCEHKEGNASCPATKYGLSYTPSREIKICFITTDFYNELSNPQISGIFGFFDNAYIAKGTSPATNIKTLDSIIDDINEAL